ncbi:MAG: DNA repair protein RecN [Pseudomonadota bacterium]
MLTEIYIKNFTIIDELHLEFQEGMHVLTGETGAGKSITIDAMELALGKRASTDVIRKGNDRAEIAVLFDITNIPLAKTFLQQNDIDNENECMVRRILHKDGRSKSYINGSPATLQTLRELSEMLMDIHGQHEFQTLTQAHKQRQLLDDFAQHGELTQQIQRLYNNWHTLQADVDHLDQVNQNASSRIEFLTYQIQELDELNVTVEDIQAVDKEHKQLSNADQLLQNCQTAIEALDHHDMPSVLSLLITAHQATQSIAAFDPKLLAAAELLNGASIQSEEALNELNQFLDQTDLNPERLNWLEQKLSKIYDLSRKHHIKPEELPELHQSMQAELGQLENKDELLAKLQAQIQKIEKEYYRVANQLSDGRKKAAKKLNALISDNMQHLGMPGGVFEIQFDTQQELSAHGLEKIIFMVSANPGYPPAPLNKIASGGELSRISLAIQVITAEYSNTPTLIFDEVDVGIGGATAEIVGKLLQQLSKKTQTLCITHLAQVAAKAHHHYQVTKTTEHNSTAVKIALLNRAQRIQEIARMTGGIKITAQTLAHAEEMLS